MCGKIAYVTVPQKTGEKDTAGGRIKHTALDASRVF